ncbi:MAG: biotin/lipoyl-containing protein, partial [Candidatus Nanopelagicales bacterium]|nr:biotin/lipoyl-containing protein [Candidatus Nanopelagicales bacterium]
MSVNVTMPQLGENVTEGTVTRWLKQVGDMVADGEPIVEVATDKVDTEIPAPASGVLVSIAAAEDDVVAVGAELAVIGAADEMSAQPPSPTSPAPASEGSTSDAPTVITLPELGESVTEGTVIRWLKSVGDTVDVDEPLVEISTDKVDTEIPSPVAGTLLQIVAAQDEVVEVGGAIGVVGSASALQSPASVPVSGAGVGASGVRLEAAGPTKGPGTGT